MSKYSEFFLLSSADYVNIGERLRLRRYGSWLTEEAWCREEQNKKRAQFSLQAIRLARKIAAVKDVTEEEAFELLQNNSADQRGIMQEFAEDINELMALSPSGREQLEELVTLFFKNRGEVFTGKKWEQTCEWSKEDTQKLPQSMMLEVEVFMAKEDANYSEDDGEEEEGPK